MKSDIELKLLNKTANAKVIDGQHDEEHIEVGQFLKSFIYGGLDGTINILVIIISGVSSNLQTYKLVAMAVAATCGDAIGMGLGDFLSTRSEQAFVLTEKERQEYEFDHFYNEQVAELNTLLKEKGYSAQDSERLGKLYSKNKDIFISIMMMTELGLVVDHVQAYKIGFINFSSFLISGMLPLIPFLLDSKAGDSSFQLTISLIIGAVQLFSLGFVKGQIIKASFQKKRRSGLQILTFGVFVSIIGFIVGSIFQKEMG